MPRKKPKAPEEKSKAFWRRYYREQRRRRQAEERQENRHNLVNARWIRMYQESGQVMPSSLIVHGDDKI